MKPADGERFTLVMLGKDRSIIKCKVHPDMKITFGRQSGQSHPYTDTSQVRIYEGAQNTGKQRGCFNNVQNFFVEELDVEIYNPVSENFVPILDFVLPTTDDLSEGVEEQLRQRGYMPEDSNVGMSLEDSMYADIPQTAQALAKTIVFK